MDEIFQIQLDKTSEVPIYRQLADAIGALASDGFCLRTANCRPSENGIPFRCQYGDSGDSL